MVEFGATAYWAKPGREKQWVSSSSSIQQKQNKQNNKLMPGEQTFERKYLFSPHLINLWYNLAFGLWQIVSCQSSWVSCGNSVFFSNNLGGWLFGQFYVLRKAFSLEVEDFYKKPEIIFFQQVFDLFNQKALEWQEKACSKWRYCHWSVSEGEK